MGPKIKQLKNCLKKTGIEIHFRRKLYKYHQRNNYWRHWNSNECAEADNNFNTLKGLQREYRHKHIAYSELRGRSRAQIEASYPYVNQPNSLKPDEAWINRIKIKYTDQSCVAERSGGGF